MKKKALITGITGQDGWFLSELLLEKGYVVYGTISSLVSGRVSHLNKDIHLIQCDLSDTNSIINIIDKIVQGKKIN